MSTVTITFKDKKRHDEVFLRAGHNYAKAVTFEGAFVTVSDEYGERHSYPVDSVLKVHEDPQLMRY